MPYAYLISVVVFPVRHRVNFQPGYGTAKCNVSRRAGHGAVKRRGVSYSFFQPALSADTGARPRENARLGTGVLVAVLGERGPGRGQAFVPQPSGLLPRRYAQRFTLVFFLASFAVMLQCHYFPFAASLSVLFPFEIMLDV